LSDVAETLELDRAVANDATWEQLQIPDKRFDVVIIYNVINHLYEDLVRRLHKHPDAVEQYVERLAKLGQIVADGGHLIIADCGRENFWGSVGVRSPTAPTIDWDIHQEPEVWTAMLMRLGFELVDQRWSPWWPFGRITASRPVQYLTSSHFVIRLVKVAGDGPS
jgi:SAM-dependent methyltransferase